MSRVAVDGEAASAVAVRVGRWEDVRPAATAIRLKVFVEEQGVSPEVELDAQDGRCWHALAYLRDDGDSAKEDPNHKQDDGAEEGTPVATGRLLPDGHIGRMAVLPSVRGRGIGALVLAALIAKARELGFSEVVLSAQTHAQGFYRRAGFVPEGEPYFEEGTDILHIDMRRGLTNDRSGMH